MTIEFAGFKAEVAKGIKIGSDVEVKLLIPLKAAVPYLEFLSNNQGEEVYVQIGDPQATFDFGDRDPMYDTWNSGRRVTTDASGVVTKIEGQGDEQKDENQAELFDGEGSSPDQQEADGDGAEQTGEGSETPQEGEGEPISEEGAGEPPTDDLPDWMRDEGTGDSEPKEMNFSSDDSEGNQQPPADENPPADVTEGATGEIDKDVLEQYIITERPSFPDMPLDFPNLFEQKRDQGVTWREIANSVGLTSGQFSSKLTKYKERVKEAMSSNGVA